MSINLSKGDKIDLKKSNPGLSNILVGLGWDPVQQSGGGFFKSLFGGGQADIDCDASVFMLNQEGKLSGIKDLIYFGNLKSACKSVLHTGDNLTGEGAGDDEQILVNLDKVPSNIHKLLFVVNIYNCVDRKQHFGMIENAYIRVEDQSNKKEIAKYNLSDNYSEKTTLIVGAIYRKDGSWQFKAIGEGTKDAGLKEVMQNLDRIECAYGI
ncbi:TerD family protein [Clostridioides sp. ES-S-0108-01]|uniref:TerD family protein n=1 Tax=unclassified Clostridioides TaxID=2635829 RepID=UPI001D0C2865|nr:TerD family protein [Clostridioides sp. ES-S-0171-01]MCC0684121.1 TerD family protein [Clostridioides sp. ZZV14-6345]MCC0687204.1 TerD family protein [Clostridioides sp. ES-S-0056-01]MCC0716161.1 TerD family protein [Clostridioides sp. ES-S-0077-01]MCC0784978.1 TerD family protein [Clostridioides sp. ES-S-0108-01]UDN52620.1 TerD family protein [Clostridioides sp. ES-S-0107-01]UDN56081.1 TerD family protein [Clostridioides sp. ES-S-0054-01]